MSPKPEIFFSVDVETDGPIPGPHSMLSLGCASFNEEGKQLGAFSVNLETLPGASGDPDTMKWWQTQPEAWGACRKDLEDPKTAMNEFVSWVKTFGGSPVFVGYPAGFDFLFVYWYIKYHGLESPFSFSALDIKTYAMAVLKTGYRESTKKNWPKRWFQDTGKHSHVAVEDAIEQGLLFMNIRRENLQGER
jgi:3' exoribonuclease, RNase T-like